MSNSTSPTSPASEDLSQQYSLYETCELINASNPVYLEDLHQQLDHLDYLDENALINMAYEPSAPSKKPPLSVSNVLEGLVQLATTGAVGATEIIEAIHSEILLRPLGRFNEDHLNRWQQGVTRRLYNVVRYTMQSVGRGVTSSSMQLYRKSLINQKRRLLPERLKQLVNVINGMVGDHLVARDNPLAVPMVLYDRYGQPLGAKADRLCGRVIVLCHGLCLSYLSWHPCEEDSLGEHIALSVPKSTVLYLDYNTGRRISQNGHNLANLLQQLVIKNPDITQIDLVGYSMGGLVSRSALFYGEQERQNWVARVGNLVTIGSPHQGAILERISYHLLDIMAKVPFAGSLSKLGDIRSAGIIDLRHGCIRDEDWKGLKVRDVLPEDFRHPTKLPRHINTFFIAGSIAEGVYESKASNLVGDGLVMIESALGEAGKTHENHHLYVPEGRKAVFYGVNHINLQYDERVHHQVSEWLQANRDSESALKPRIHSFPDEIEVVV